MKSITKIEILSLIYTIMKIKRWCDFLSYIRESIEDKEFDPWILDEEVIKEYFHEAIDEGYQIEVRYGFVGQERQWNYKESRTQYVERFTKKMESGSNQPAISIIIKHTRQSSSNDVSDNLKFAYSIISEEADAEIAILDADGDIGNIDGIIAKDGLFFTETWNKVEGEEPIVTEAEGYIEFLVKQKETIKVSQTQLAKYYNWGSYEEKDGMLWVEYNLEDLSDQILSSSSNYKDLLINSESIYDNYWGSDHQPDIISLFDYLNKENKSLAVKALIKEYGGLEDFLRHISKKLDNKVYDEVKEIIEREVEGEESVEESEERKIGEITEYLLKDRYYNVLKQLSKDSEIIGDIKMSYGDWSANAHADANLEDIRGEFDSILNDNFTYRKGTREIEKEYKFSNGKYPTYKEEETFYLIRFDNKWIEETDFDDIENERLTSIFEDYLDKNGLNRFELNPLFSDYGDVDEKAWNKDVKSDLMRFLSKK